ncbi:hypothetical protein [Hydrogenophaga sp.]|uniref:hypothetical protein n=1 Tax=Hydrogenophaga sp. TaxID=1904254 RepID=UPI0025C345A3|nr:hypothetical protein [Hydrogenophaga sp.]
MPISPEVLKLRELAKSQLFVMDLRETDAPGLLAAQLGGPDAKQPVVWRDAESELLVFPGSTVVRFAPGFVFVELAVLSDQTGDARLLFAFKIGASPNEASLTAVAEDRPRGNAVLAKRWAQPATELVWHALLRCGEALLARRRLKSPQQLGGVYTLGRVLSFITTEPVTTEGLRGYYAEAAQREQPLDPSILNRRFLGSVPLRRTTKR